MERREVHRYPGILTGIGGQFTCVVETTTLYKTGLPPVHYETDVISINGRPTDGPYQLQYDGEVDAVRVSNGFVLAAM